jgi:hypothetical protein
MKRIKKTLEYLDWVGVVCILAAYTLSLFGYLSVRSPYYLGLNILGSALVGYISWKKRDLQPMVLNATWIAIAILSVLLRHE